MAAVTMVNGNASSSDWGGRYHHVDQILDRPGPRTDPSFLAGAEVSGSYPPNDVTAKPLSPSVQGQGILA